MTAGTLALAYGEGAQPRDRRDLYVEPPEVVDALCRVEQFEGPIWDPAAGTRSLVGVMTRHGYDVHATDGNDPDRLDFLSIDAMRFRGQHDIVTNPPYEQPILDRFMRRALTLAKGKVALFLPLYKLGGEDRHRTIFAPCPPSRVWVFTHRIGMDKGGTGKFHDSGMIPYMWVVWDLPSDPARATTMRWISCR